MGPYIYHALLAFSQALALALQLVQHRRGLRASPRIICFWLYVAITAIMKLRTITLSGGADSRALLETVGILASALVLVLIQEFMPVEAAVDGKRCNPLQRCGLLTYASFGFIWGKLLAARRRTLVAENPDDVWDLDIEESTGRCDDRLTQELEKSVAAGIALSPLGLFVALVRSQMLMSSAAVGFKVIASVLVLVQPMLLDTLINYVLSYSTPTPQPRSTGYIIALGIFLVGLLSTVINVWGSQLSWLLYYRWKVATTAVVFKKSLRLAPSSRVENSTGNVSNLMSNDAMETGFLAANLPQVVAIIIQLVVAIVLLWMQLSYAVIAMIVLVLMLGPAQSANASFVGKWSDKQFEIMDERLALTTEVMNAIKVVKMNAWEKYFMKKLKGLRSTELKYLFIRRVGEMIAVILGNLPPLIIFVVTIGVYIAIAPAGQPLDVTRVFVSFAIFNLLKAPLVELAPTLPSIAVSWTCVRRVVEFLREPELETYIQQAGKAGSVSMERASFTWGTTAAPEENSDGSDGKPGDETKSTMPFTLSNISVDIHGSDFIGVLGPVGSGKSSLLSALLGQMQHVSGSVSIGGTVAYVSQKPWIFQSTLRDNILLGRPFDLPRYERVMDACALRADLAALPDGDRTEIGERGGNLSGGQRQRVALARAVYGDADIYLFDDVLSAVDRRVAAHIYENVLSPRGLLADRTRVLVTHAVRFLEEVRVAYVMEAGSVVAEGTYAELTEKGKVPKGLTKEGADTDSVKGEEGTKRDEESDGDKSDRVTVSDVADDDKMALLGDVSISENVTTPLIEDEEVEEGTFNLSVLMMYLRACSLGLFVFLLLGICVSEGVNLGSRYWLQNWTNDPDMSQATVMRYFKIYALLVLAYVVLYPLAGGLFLCLMSIRAGSHIHDTLLSHLLKMPMSFFTVTPAGRIMNRLSNDLAGIDVGLPDSFYDMIFALAGVIVNVLPTLISIPVFSVVLVVAGVLCAIVMRLYVPASIGYLRFKGVFGAMIWSHVDETLDGIDSVKAYGLEKEAISKNEANQDRLQSALLMYYSANRWFSVWIGVLSVGVIFASCLLAVSLAGSLSATAVALAVSTILVIMQETSVMMTQLGTFQTDLVSAERLKQYLDLPAEDWKGRDDIDAKWPAEGVVEFENVCLRYREGLDLALNHLSFTIRSGEKIGVVGRTGAGKSSLAQALLRLVDLTPPTTTGEQGAIRIDGLDISTISLPMLRSRLAIVPQESFLFTGTIRENLDPEELAADDAALWSALEKVTLKEVVAGMGRGLDAAVNEEGSNFSVGQQQLICLARALIRGSKVVILDEATASVDMELDEVIQRIIMTEFADCSVITIAHRINTVINYDKILVLEKGSLAEFGSPKELLSNESSIFFQLANDH
ncbi:Multidrug resistance-associated protein 1 [Irineochytrium annulatum]|nr:Multidrug resistance-associated protein 1 [Irineochytrium annulatum]